MIHCYIIMWMRNYISFRSVNYKWENLKSAYKIDNLLKGNTHFGLWLKLNATMSPVLDVALQHIYVEIIEKFTLINVNVFEFEYRPWVFSVLGSIAIALMGVLPLLIIPVETGGTDFSDRKSKNCNRISDNSQNFKENSFL